MDACMGDCMNACMGERVVRGRRVGGPVGRWTNG